MKMTENQIAEAKRATARARKVLRPGDRLSIRGCGGQRSRVVMVGWDRDWITSRWRSDVHAMHVYRVNGKAVSFCDRWPPLDSIIRVAPHKTVQILAWINRAGRDCAFSRAQGMWAKNAAGIEGMIGHTSRADFRTWLAKAGRQ